MVLEPSENTWALVSLQCKADICSKINHIIYSHGRKYGDPCPIYRINMIMHAASPEVINLVSFNFDVFYSRINMIIHAGSSKVTDQSCIEFNFGLYNWIWNWYALSDEGITVTKHSNWSLYCGCSQMTWIDVIFWSLF